VKSKKGVLGMGSILIIIGAMLLSVSVATGSGEKGAHFDLTEQEKFISCADCHRETTPEVENEWYDSTHGIAMIKCYPCHGTFETFVVTPSKQNCATCHTNMLEKCPQDKPCWECHVPHSFKAKK